MSNMKIVVIVGFIISVGIFIRFNNYSTIHPNGDEHFELKNLYSRNILDIFKNGDDKNQTMYGDHTSFPGEMLLHYLPMRVMDYFGFLKEPEDGWNTYDYLSLVSPKIILYLISIFIFIKLSLFYIKSKIGLIAAILIYTFNQQLIHHAFELRPYGVLPELAVFNLYFCYEWFNKDRKTTPVFTVFYFLLIFFTSIYHAYGILIALLPIFYNFYKTWNMKRCVLLWPAIFISISAWVYYASYNTFGMIPNAVQSKVNPFQFMPPNVFQALFTGLFGNQLLMIIMLPFVAANLFRRHSLDYYLFLFIMIVFPLVTIVAVDIKTSYWILPRQWTWVIPYFALFCGMSLDGGDQI